jgi:zinc protease
MQVLAFLLAGSPTTSILERRLTHDEGLTITTWASYLSTALDQGTFSIGVMPVPGVSLQEAEDAMDRVLADFIETGPDMEQLERVRMQIRAQGVFQLDNTAERAQSIGADLAIGLTLEDNREWLDILQSITPDELVAAARSLDRNASVTGWLMQEDL